MNVKKMTVALGATLLVAGAVAYFTSRNESPEEARRIAEANRKEGVVNSDPSPSAARTQPMPQQSSQRFEPPPTIATGSYTDPAYRKPADPKATPAAR